MALPEIQVTDEPTEDGSVDELGQIPDPNPEGKRKGVDYEHLLELLFQCSYLHKGQKPAFWSYSLLTRILTKERILEELTDYGKSDPTFYNTERNARYANEILADGGKTYVKIFAILVLVGKGKSICDFMREGICDGELPLTLCEVERNSKYQHFLARRSAPKEQIQCISNLGLIERDSFYKRQYHVNVPSLSLGPNQTIRHEDFESSVILPWLSFDSPQSGGYGTVHRARTPEDAHRFHDVLKSIVFDNQFAVKKLNFKDGKRTKEQEIQFRKEVDNLKRLRGTIHDHLVTLLMTWTLGGKYFFLFPWAEHDLDNYWEDSTNQLERVSSGSGEMKLQDAYWISSQILGMSEALHSIHNPSHLYLTGADRKYGRHGDLKPENILFYKSPMYERGILVIADFGLTSFNSDKSRSNIPGEAVPRTPGYRPPECDLEGGVISRAFDIWTFGCLLLELVCWALGGKTLREKFNDDRCTDYITGSKSDIFFEVKKTPDEKSNVLKVKEEVRKCIVFLHGLPTCTEYFHVLLDLIEKKMIIILTEHRERISSGALLEKIREMHERAVSTPDYCQKLCPQRRDLKPSAGVAAKLNETALGNLTRNRGARLGIHPGKLHRSKTPDELKAME